MRRRARHALLTLLFAAAACNGVTRPCKKGTVLASVTFNGASVDADTLDVSVSVDDGTPRLTNIDHVVGAATGTIEITFPSGYPMSHEVRVFVVARNGGTAVANAAHRSRSIAPALRSCSTLGDPTTGGDVDLGTCAPTCSGVACGEVSGCNCGTCALHAIEVPSAQRGDTLRLEGRFAPGDAMVRFGNGATVAATQIAPGRLRVVVPDAPAFRTGRGPDRRTDDEHAAAARGRLRSQARHLLHALRADRRRARHAELARARRHRHR